MFHFSHRFAKCKSDTFGFKREWNQNLHFLFLSLSLCGNRAVSNAKLILSHRIWTVCRHSIAGGFILPATGMFMNIPGRLLATCQLLPDSSPHQNPEIVHCNVDVASSTWENGARSLFEIFQVDEPQQMLIAETRERGDGVFRMRSNCLMQGTKQPLHGSLMNHLKISMGPGKPSKGQTSQRLHLLSYQETKIC